MPSKAVTAALKILDALAPEVSEKGKPQIDKLRAQIQASDDEQTDMAAKHDEQMKQAAEHIEKMAKEQAESEAGGQSRMESAEARNMSSDVMVPSAAELLVRNRERLAAAPLSEGEILALNDPAYSGSNHRDFLNPKAHLSPIAKALQSPALTLSRARRV